MTGCNILSQLSFLDPCCNRVHSCHLIHLSTSKMKCVEFMDLCSPSWQNPLSKTHLGVQDGRILREARGECLVGRVSHIVAIGCLDCSQQTVGEEDSLALWVAQGQDVDVLQTPDTINWMVQAVICRQLSHEKTLGAMLCDRCQRPDYCWNDLLWLTSLAEPFCAR